MIDHIGYHLRGIDYMVEAKLAEGRAKEAEQKVQGWCIGCHAGVGNTLMVM